MRVNRSVFVLAIAAVWLCGSVLQASAGTGKRISTALAPSSGIIALYPATTTLATVPVPTSYKSKTSFLKVTVSYQWGCYGGDHVFVFAKIDGHVMNDSNLPFDNDANGYGTTSRTFYLDPESLGGPAIAAGAPVNVVAGASIGTQCTVAYGSVVVEAQK